MSNKWRRCALTWKLPLQLRPEVCAKVGCNRQHHILNITLQDHGNITSCLKKLEAALDAYKQNANAARLLTPKPTKNVKNAHPKKKAKHTD